MTQGKSPAWQPGSKGSTCDPQITPSSSREPAESQDLARGRADAARLLGLNQTAIAGTPNVELIGRMREAARIVEGRIELALRRLDDIDAAIRLLRRAQ